MRRQFPEPAELHLIADGRCTCTRTRGRAHDPHLTTSVRLRSVAGTGWRSQPDYLDRSNLPAFTGVVDDSADAEHVELPVACTLGSDDGRARMLRWQQLADRANPAARRSGHRLEVRFEDGPGVQQELELLAAAEQQCCSFVTWAVATNEPVLHVTAPVDNPDAVEPIALLFGAR